ncbi:2-dehydro-3-deoxy-phosphogluconate aldolase [Morella rubra]|uniref:2-dehydro-3-deoxy-phosphogluconate aldolase n=1 Tax=Morella rubra TaxID=262757 RepID=A0A6A1WPT5_9ROSI|nr:2-dehydro-3-deoxy-phosphogluconate aldolase [Morella rubra]
MAIATLGMCASTSSASLSLFSAPPLTRLTVSCSSSLSWSPVDKTLTQIQNSGVIACLRANSAKLALKAARAALSGGISVVLQQLVHEHPTTALGVILFLGHFQFTIHQIRSRSYSLKLPSFLQIGTVLNVEDAKNAKNAGAKFLMSPAMIKDITVEVQCGEVVYIPGVMTPTEILAAYDAGAKIVKVYPVSALGGSQYISALKRPFDHISMVASQGITIDSIGEYIARGATSVVLSDAIFDREAIGRNNFNEIYQLAQSAALLGNKAVER